MGVITRAEDLYLPPPHLSPTAWEDDPPAMLCIRWYAECAGRRILTDPEAVAGTLYAQVNHGRWTATCTCYSAQIVTPADPRMWCVECGTGWWQVTFPADVAAVEQQLAVLPVAERNWWATEDPADPSRPTLEV
jgi:hypothetical protein